MTFKPGDRVYVLDRRLDRIEQRVGIVITTVTTTVAP